MQLKIALTNAITSLTKNQVPSPRINAELLLMFTLNCDRAYLYAHPERELTAEESSRYDAALADRARGVPAQYITGHQEFWGMDLIVSPAVLIPRPETEHVIETVLELQTADRRPQTSARIPLSAVRGPRSEVALRIAAGRAPRDADRIMAAARDAGISQIDHLVITHWHGDHYGGVAELAGRIQFHEMNLLEGFPPSSFDFIVSNPPYVGESEADQVQLEVRKFEPRSAVFSGPTGLETIARLIPQARTALRASGWLVMEISGTVADRVAALLDGWNNVRLVPDLQSIPRVAVAQKL